MRRRVIEGQGGVVPLYYTLLAAPACVRRNFQ